MTNTRHFNRAALCGLLLAAATLGASAATLNVPAQYPTIQAGISAAQPGDTVLIADGAYTGVGNVALDFGGKAITVTSQNGAANCIIDGQDLTYDVRFHSGETAAARLQNLTIQGGLSAANGGGVQITGGSTPTIVGCTFTKNLAVAFGGGIYADATANPTVTDCAFISNQFVNGQGSVIADSGAGMYVGGSATITRCSFAGNTVSSHGGALYLNGSSAIVTACTFTGNSGAVGGAVYCGLSGNIVSGCAFTGNTASATGGGYYGGSQITNCTFTANKAATQGGGAFVTGAVTNGAFTGNSAPLGAGLFGNQNTTVLNSILYGDGGPEISASGTSVPAVTFSDVQGGYPGTGNFNADPLFVNPPNDLHLRPGSPALFAGTPNGAPATDKDGHVRPNPPSLGALEPVPAALPDIADSSVLSGASAGQNFGSAPTLLIGGFLGAAYIKFDLSNLGLLGPNSTVRLHLNAGMAQKGTASVIVSATSADWTETGLTFLNRPRPTLPLGFLNVNASGTGSAPYDVDITDYVKSQQAAGASQLALALSQYQFGPPVSLDSRENPAQDAPQLVVTY